MFGLRLAICSTPPLRSVQRWREPAVMSVTAVLRTALPTGVGLPLVVGSADGAREIGLDWGESCRDEVNLIAVWLLQIGQSRSRPFGPADEIPAVDGPVAKIPTGDRVNGVVGEDGGPAVV